MATQNSIDNKTFIYASHDPDNFTAAGSIIASGTLSQGASTTQSIPVATSSLVDGFFSFQGATPTVPHYLLPNFGSPTTTAAGDLNATRLARGAIYRLKGKYAYLADARLASTHEKMAIGIVAKATTNDIAIVGNQLEATRDDRSTIAVVVDSSNNIQSYNCLAAGDAAYADSLHNADLTGTEFEITINVPAAADTMDDIAITITMEDDAGTMRTILSSATPTGTDGLQTLYLFIMVNQNAYVTGLAYEIEKL